VQASILSGTYPNEHGIIANGFYDRINHNVSFWEQSSDLVQTDRIWDIVDKKNSDNNKAKSKDLSSTPSSSPSASNLKTAVLFWQNTMYSKANIVVTPRPLHFDNGMVMWCYSKPVGYNDQELKSK